MKTVFSLFLILFAGGWLSATPNPRDSAFLNSFNDKQKTAIHRYPSGELEKPINQLINDFD